jgi:hypothetical protein
MPDLRRVQKLLGLGLLSGGLWLAGSACERTSQLSAGECQCGCPECNGRECHKYAERRYSLQSRAAVHDSLDAQAAQGRLHEQTLWNNYFVPQSAELHSSGRAFLDRMARRYRGRAIDLYVQTAHDLPFNSEQLDAFSRDRDALDLERATAAHRYLTIVLRQPPPEMYVHDPQRFGMWAYEAAPAYAIIKKSPQGLLDQSAISGVEPNDSGYGSIPLDLGGGAIGGGAFGGGSFGPPIFAEPPPFDMSGLPEPPPFDDAAGYVDEPPPFADAPVGPPPDDLPLPPIP